MKSKKAIWGILIVIVLLIVIFVVWVLPKNMGPIQPFLNFGDIFTAGDGETPGKPVYYQIGLDCTTGNLVTPGELIQPELGCDDWRINRFERPFNAISQNEYYPDLDIQYAYLGRDADWYYLRLALFDSQPGTEFLAGTYAMEMDLDVDGRGDLLVLVSEPGKETGKAWSTRGVQIWADSNNDVGGRQPDIPEDGVVANGYDTLVFNQGNGNDPNGAWARAFMSGSAYVELAFKTDYLKGDIAFKWWVWGSYGNYSPDMFEFHDFYNHPQTGDTNKGMDFFPIKEVFAMDSSCANMWGASPDPADPDFCLGEEFVIEPGEDTCLLLKFIIPLLPCRIPRDIPGDGPCVLAYKDWVALVWQPEHPGETPTNEEKLWHEYEEYLKDPFCPPGIPGSTQPPDGTKPPPDETKPPGDDDDESIVTVELTEPPGDDDDEPIVTVELTEPTVEVPTEPPTEEVVRICNFDCVCDDDRGETEYNCPKDCPKHCGNGMCDCDENPCTCRKDCGKPDPNDECCECGDGKCMSACGENPRTCPEDCS